MFKNFDAVKAQLKELSEVVNSFKSEAVQLRIIELVFGAEPETTEPAATSDRPAARSRKSRRPAPKPVRPAAPSAKVSTARQSRSGSRLGGKAVLAKLYEDGFFKQARTINDIVAHADTNMATKLKQSDFSGGLARYVREQKLKRTKNADKQYEYVEG